MVHLKFPLSLGTLFEMENPYRILCLTLLHYGKYFLKWYISRLGNAAKLLTPKWSIRGVSMDPKISFRASARKCRIPDPAVFWLLHAYHPASSDMCLKIIWRLALRGNCFRDPMDPRLTTNGKTLDKNNFLHTRDLWPLVATLMWTCGTITYQY